MLKEIGDAYLQAMIDIGRLTESRPATICIAVKKQDEKDVALRKSLKEAFSEE